MGGFSWKEIREDAGFWFGILVLAMIAKCLVDLLKKRAEIYLFPPEERQQQPQQPPSSHIAGATNLRHLAAQVLELDWQLKEQRRDIQDHQWQLNNYQWQISKMQYHFVDRALKPSHHPDGLSNIKSLLGKGTRADTDPAPKTS